MALFKGDLPLIWRPFVGMGLTGSILVGFLIGFFLSNVVAYVLAAVLIIMLVLAFADMKGRELDVLYTRVAIASLVVLLLVMLITNISVNGWWTAIIPNGILRQ